MLQAWELEGIRSTVEESFPDTVVVRHQATGTSDTEGNWTAGDATSTTYSGRLIQRLSDERAEVQQEITGWSVLLPHDAVVDSSDQILVDDYTFEVIGPPVHQPSPGDSTHLRVALRHVGV